MNPSAKDDHEITQQHSRKSWDVTLQEWLAQLAEHYPLELSELNIHVWREGCADLNSAQLDAGFRRMIRTVEHKPNVAKLHRMIRELEESTDYIKPHVDTPEDIELEKERIDRQREFDRQFNEVSNATSPPNTRHQKTTAELDARRRELLDQAELIKKKFKTAG